MGTGNALEEEVAGKGFFWTGKNAMSCQKRKIYVTFVNNNNNNNNNTHTHTHTLINAFCVLINLARLDNVQTQSSPLFY